MRKVFRVILSLLILCSLWGCSVQKLSIEKLRDIDFTVVEKEDIPEELAAMIAEKETQVFKLTYADQGALYVAEGYGKQSTNGYSIEVKECYETNNAIYVRTNLIGPAKDEKIVDTDTYPYIVIKMEFIDKNIVFE